MKNSESAILVHYNEVALKGRNRPFFERQLVANIKLALKRAGLADFQVKRLVGRLLVSGVLSEQRPKAQAALGKVFGIASFAWVQVTAAAPKAIESAVLDLAKGLTGSFRIEARRASKTHAFTSQDLNENLGEVVLKATGAGVNLTHPDTTFYIEVLNKEAFVYTQKISGPGGLPVGASGRVVVLMSSGIDSPVAAWYLAKRGCPLTLVHFHSYPFTNKKSQESVKDLAKVLGVWAPETRLYLVPLGEVQKRIITDAPAKYRVLLYRRAMIRLAEQVAQKDRALALVTGESVGQVASQTIENIAAVNAAATLPILRPLAGSDKIEITAVAQKIGTYEVSIRPADDCCSFMVPQNPETKARLIDIERSEGGIKFGDELSNAIINTEKITYQ